MTETRHLQVWEVVRTRGTVDAAAAFVEAQVPWRLVDGRLTRAAQR